MHKPEQAPHALPWPAPSAPRCNFIDYKGIYIWAGGGQMGYIYANPFLFKKPIPAQIFKPLPHPTPPKKKTPPH